MAASAQGAVRVGWQDQRAANLAGEAPTAFAAARYMGAREMRLNVLWNKVQPTPDAWDWSTVDAAVARAGEFSVQLVLGGIGGRPPAWAGGGAVGGPIGDGTWNHLNDRAFVRFVSAAARRYAGRVRIWSILNEADLTGYPAERYASLYTRSRRAIRRFAGHRTRVLWGEFSPHAPVRYTRRALLASPTRVVADGFAVHPYADRWQAKLEGGLHRLGDLKRRVTSWSRRKRKRLTLRNGARLPLYATEFGCQTRIFDEAECARQWKDGLQRASKYGLRQLVAYQLIPSDHATWDTSLLRPDGMPSLAMQLIATWTGLRPR
jgi:hypothetical protein